MKKTLRSLPPVRTLGLILAAGAAFGWLNVHSLTSAAVGLVLGLLFVGILTTRNANPEGYQALYDPTAYAYREHLDDTSRYLQELVTAVEQDNGAMANPAVAYALTGAKGQLVVVKQHRLHARAISNVSA